MVMRKAEHRINDLILNRWSPRAMSGEAISKEELMQLFEAARWAPSSYNNQPWRFVYALRDTPAWAKLFDLLVPFNKAWAKNAGVLMVIISANNFTFNNTFSRTHAFDTGSAWQNLALQGSSMGLVVHGIEGFDYDRARVELHIPDGYTIQAMCAIGHPGKIEDLPAEIQTKETPSGRKPLTDFIFEGEFKS
jgi:nitroreductase